MNKGKMVMPRFWTKEYSFSRGVVRNPKLAYFALTQDDLAEQRKPHAILAQWDDGEWHQQNVRWDAVAVVVADRPEPQVILVGEWGDVLTGGRSGAGEDEVRDGNLCPEDRGSLRAACNISGRVYVAGMDRQVYRWEGPKRWTCIDETMRPPEDSEEVVGFESIDGFAEDDIYAVGWDGAIFHYNGKKWTEIHSPTNLILTGVCCAGDGNVYACGQTGTLLRGRGKKWEIVQHDSTEQDLYGIAWFNDRLYLASLRMLFTLKDETLRGVIMRAEPIAKTCYHLSAADGVLWSIGAKDVMAFDGKRWKRID